MKSQSIDHCPTCDSPRPEKYCSNCGEKKVEAADFTLKYILGEGFSFLTNLDSKLYKTIVYLLFKPGSLAKAYVEGRRRNYMKPFQVFVLASIFFYFFMSEMDIFLVPSQWFFLGDTFEIVESKMAAYDWTMEMVAEKYDQQVVSNSKLFVLLLLPFWALVIFIFNWKKEKEFGKYLILALYELSFFMILGASTAIVKYLPLQGMNFNKWWILTPVIVLFLTHLTLSIRNFFDRPLIPSLFQGVIVFFLFLLFIVVYRNGISYFTLMNL